MCPISEGLHTHSPYFFAFSFGKFCCIFDRLRRKLYYVMMHCIVTTALSARQVAQGMSFFNTPDLIPHQSALQEASQDLEGSHDDSLKQHSTPPKPESKEAGRSGEV